MGGLVRKDFNVQKMVPLKLPLFAQLLVCRSHGIGLGTFNGCFPCFLEIYSAMSFAVSRKKWNVTVHCRAMDESKRVFLSYV